MKAKSFQVQVLSWSWLRLHVLGGDHLCTLHRRDSLTEGEEEPSGSQLVHVPGGIVTVH